MVFGVALWGRLQPVLGGDLATGLAEDGHDALQLRTSLVIVDRVTVLDELVRHHHVIARANGQSVGGELHVATPFQGRADGGLVGRSVTRKSNITEGSKDLAFAELRRQFGQQLRHRSPDQLLVFLLVVLPVGPGVVGLQAFIEIDGLGRPTAKRHAPYATGWPGRPRGRR
jgi:hypothetical protein